MPWDRSKYPQDWERLVKLVATRAGGQCECLGECGRCKKGVRCEAMNHQPSPVTGKKVTLTTAHLDHDTQNSDLENLRHFCNGCHLRYDRFLHAKNARDTRIRKKEEAGQLNLMEHDQAFSVSNLSDSKKDLP